MAAVSASAANLTPPSSSHGTRAWDYAVPLNPSIPDIHSYYNTSSSANTTNQPSKGPLVLPKQRASLSEQNRPNPYSRFNGQALGPASISSQIRNDFSQSTTPDSNTLNGISRPLAATPRALASEKEEPTDDDSVIDFYSNRLSGISTMNETYPNVNGSLTAMYDLSGDIDNAEASRWIYRDKLLRIESQEKRKTSITSLQNKREEQERGRSNSGTDQKRRNRPDEQTRDQEVCDVSDYEDDSDGPAHDTEFDLRSPEEKENDLISYQPPRRIGRATSYSRIPLSTTSPKPIPQEYLERSAPLHRPESDEFEMVLDNTYARSRQRSQSVGSSILLDTDKAAQQSTPSPPDSAGSAMKPSKSVSGRTPVTPSPRRPTSSNKNAPFSHNKSRSRSQNGLGRGTNMTPTGTPSSSKHTAPEGPPPWSLSSYSPDPKLPPDQQIIPTVAKRLQQEQWERDGVYASVYDRELRPLKVHTDESDGITKDGEKVSERPDTEWPLKKPTSPASVAHTPPIKIETPNRTETPKSTKPAKPQPTRVQDPGEVTDKKGEKKGCCACVIM